MLIMNAGNDVVQEVVGSTVLDLPSGSIAFIQHKCEFCKQQGLCLVHDDTYGEYAPRSICEQCISLLK